MSARGGQWGRRRFLGTLAAAAAGGVLARLEWAVAAGLPDLSLIFYTDVHAMPGLSDEALLERAAAAISAESADVVIAGGDVIHRGHVSGVEACRPRYRLYREFVAKLPPGVQHIVGNHDLAGASPEDGGEAAADARQLWREELGICQAARSFDAGGYRFLLLDSIELLPGDKAVYRGAVGAAGLARLDEQLAGTPAGVPIFLCSHIPLESPVMRVQHGAEVPPALLVADAGAVLERFAGRPPVAVLQGHLHYWEEHRPQGLPHLIAGAVSGAWWKGSVRGTPPGYARIRVQGGTLTWEYVALA